MLNVSVRQFRFVCVVALLSLALVQLPGLGLISFSDAITTARKWRYFEASVSGWLLWLYAAADFLLILVSLIGMLNFWGFARWCLVIATVIGILMHLFLGLSVYSPYEGFLAGIFGFSCVWLLTISFWTPMAKRFGDSDTPGGSIVP
jgi:hypothetical protein